MAAAKLIAVLTLVSVVTFLLLEMIPGDPLAVMLPEGASPEMRAAAAERFGLAVHWCSVISNGSATPCKGIWAGRCRHRSR